MSAALVFYLIAITVFFGCNALMVMGLNLQFGLAGVINLAYYVLVATGGYLVALSVVGPASAQGAGIVTYVGGWHLPWWIAWLIAGFGGAVIATMITLVVVRRLRSDYLAIGTLALGAVAYLLIGNTSSFLNGWTGLSGVAMPLHGIPGLTRMGHSEVFAALVLAFVVLGAWVSHRLTVSPFGRSLRAIRDNEGTAAACGKNVAQLRLKAMIIGGVFAALGGALFIQYIGSISPAMWAVPETIVMFAALIVGGKGNTWGALLGAALVPVGFLEATRFLPAIGSNPDILPALRWVAIGLLLMGFLYFRPQGILPERKTLLWSAPRRVPVGGGGSGALPIGEPPRGRAVAPAAGAATAGARARTDALLAVRHVSKAFGGVKAVQDASFEVRRGSITALIGPNGAGKSTMLGIIAGAVEPDGGSVVLDGTPLPSLAHRVAHRRVGRTFQIPQEFPTLTVLENMMVAPLGQVGEGVWTSMLAPRRWRRAQRGELDRAWELLELFDIDHLAHEYAANLSGGQKKLLEFARALQGEPALLLLDEPMAGVNPELASSLERHIVAIAERGITVLMVEHEMGIVGRICDPVVVMDRGRVLTEGSFDQIREDEDVVTAYLGGGLHA
jgi:branched-chain amino acid transport system permease protein